MKRSKFVKKLAEMIAKAQLDWDVDAKTIYPSQFASITKKAEAVTMLIDEFGYWVFEQDEA